MAETDSRGRRKPKPQPDSERVALGRRLAAARELAGFTLDSASKALADKGYVISKAAIGAWEVGRNLPDALWLRRLAKLYGSTLDALVWEDALSMEAIRIAVEFDNLNEQQKSTWRLLWLGYMARHAEGGEALPLAPRIEVKE